MKIIKVEFKSGTTIERKVKNSRDVKTEVRNISRYFKEPLRQGYIVTVRMVK